MSCACAVEIASSSIRSSPPNGIASIAFVHGFITTSNTSVESPFERHALRFPDRESIGEGFDLIFRAAEATPVAIDVDALAVYRESNDVARLSHTRSDTLIAPPAPADIFLSTE